MEKICLEEWFDYLVEELRKLKYNGLVNTDSFKLDYEKGLTPEKAAKEFIRDILGE